MPTNTTIITEGELLAAMPKISDEAYSMNIEMAIKDTELFYIKPRIGDELYAEYIDNPTDHQTELYGGPTGQDGGNPEILWIAGLRQAEFHLAYAHLLRDNAYVSIYGTVQKRDDYSDQLSVDNIMKLAHYHWTIGTAYLRELCEYLGIKWNDRTNNDYFNEYL